MTVERGIVLNGVVLPGTDFVLRDTLAWFDPVKDAADVPKRVHWPITQIVYHWTAGHAHLGGAAASRVVRAMKARLRTDGSLMSVSCHFVVSWDGLVFQVADLGRMAIHAGRVLNRDGIGVEQCWPGTERQMLKLGAAGQVQRRQCVEGPIDCMRPSESMLAASVRLAEAIAALPPSTRVHVPRVVPATTQRMKPAPAARFRGVCEHVHSPGSEKQDCAGYVVDALAAAGWARA